MAFVAKNLHNGQLSVGTTVLYTVPVGSSAVIMDISLVNTHTAAVDCNVFYRKAAGVLRRIVPKNLRVARDAQFQRSCKLTMGPGDTIEGNATVAAVIDTVISGVEQA